MVDAKMPDTISVADVLRGVDASAFMREAAWLDEAMAAGRAPLIIDVRAESAYLAGHIPGSVAVSLRQLPDRFDTRPPREREVFCVCGGSIQSAMAELYLRTLGFTPTSSTCPAVSPPGSGPAARSNEPGRGTRPLQPEFPQRNAPRQKNQLPTPLHACDFMADFWAIALPARC